MSTDPSVRRLLPSAQMGTVSFTPPVYPQPRESQKNYVFVDEHNRHKRLKVMRACEGCRRRKIKCDAATTNTWPCSACTRLKLQCVRPNGWDGSTEPQVYEPPQSHLDQSHLDDGFCQQLSLVNQHLLVGGSKAPALYASQSSFTDNASLYNQVQYQEHTVSHGLHYTTVPSPMNGIGQPYTQQNVFPSPPMQQARAEDTPEPFQTDQYGQGDLADLLGSFKIDEAGTAPYLNNKMGLKSQEEEPAVEDADDYKSYLPPLTSGPGLKIRIPPELMPDDATILHYFDLYFTNVHPYVPVLDKSHFYHQWQMNRESLSPLLVEAIFAIAGRLADEPAQGQQWLALATRHADSFMDVPRLSTLQALIIILKAREQVPKKGYYYRSWMSIVQCVQMAKDLGLDEHLSDHQAGRPCGNSPSDCLLKTRIWQNIFICEVMIGSPQARTDLQVEIDSVNFSVPRPMPGGDESEFHVSRNFTYLARVVRNIARMNRAYARLRKTKDWGIDPEFVQISPALDAWLSELPADMAITFAPDASAPWLPSPFLGNLHSYYYLTVILFHRPQLAFLQPGGSDGQWKHHMVVSYTAAKMLCRLQEATLNNFGVSGLQCMQRGINFTIYAVLACIVLHLVALTSPDPDLNTDARQYFTRHMRILEKCMGAWPMLDMQKQVDSLREAFSADTRKPFVLKPGFAFGSPLSATEASPPRLAFRSTMSRGASMDHINTQVHHSQMNYAHHHPISPPTSAGPADSKPDSTSVSSALTLMASGQHQQQANLAALPLTDAQVWNPNRIFDLWNTSFGTQTTQPPSTPGASQIKSLSLPSSGVAEVPSMQDIQVVHAQLPPETQAIPYTAGPIQTFVTPAMWQESVSGLKRSWDGR